MSNYIFLDLHRERFGVSSMVKPALHGERCSLESPSWSSSVRPYFYIFFLFNFFKKKTSQPLVILSSHLSSTDLHVPLFTCSINSTNISSYTSTNNLLQRIREDCFIPRHSNMSLRDYMYNRFVCVLYSFWRWIAMVVIVLFLREL